MSAGIRYVQYPEINKEKWDQCIDNAPNGLIYPYSFYLDTMARHWDALVLNEYEAVMPLTWNSKFGIRYLYQPFLTAQLGVFVNRLSEYSPDDFIKVIPASFKYIDISLNSGNILSKPAGFDKLRSNYVLSLNSSYNTLSEKYNENTRRNIRKSIQEGCNFQKGFPAENIIGLAIAQMRKQGHESKENTERFRKLYDLLLKKGMATTYGLFREGKLLASAVFLFSHNRAYYILVGNAPEGRGTGASHALIDAFIKDNAGKDLLLDFEGSDIPTLATFYRGFGAINEPYPALRINKLPFYLKWLKS